MSASLLLFLSDALAVSVKGNVISEPRRRKKKSIEEAELYAVCEMKQLIRKLAEEISFLQLWQMLLTQRK